MVLPPSSSIIRVVSSADSSRLSTATTEAPSRANSIAIARRLPGAHHNRHPVLQALTHFLSSLRFICIVGCSAGSISRGCENIKGQWIEARESESVFFRFLTLFMETKNAFWYNPSELSRSAYAGSTFSRVIKVEMQWI